VRLQSFRYTASHSVVLDLGNNTSTVCLASGLREAFSRHQSANIFPLFPGYVSAAFADSPFPHDDRPIALKATPPSTLTNSRISV
jgi:hypothetical protein